VNLIAILGFSKDGRIFDYPSTFFDCCPRYRIRFLLQEYKPDRHKKRALVDMESIALISAPLIKAEEARPQIQRVRSNSSLNSVDENSDSSSMSPLSRVLKKSKRSMSTNSIRIIKVCGASPLLLDAHLL